MLSWTCRPFAALDAATLYEILALRSQVFVLEQRCVYLDPDGLDPVLLHLQGRDVSGGAGNLQAYARLVPPRAKGAQQPLPMIGRVVTAPTARGAGQGRALMQQAIAECGRLWPGQTIEISAQQHLERFYASLGFEPVSAPYDEDGILHVDMRRRAVT
jgi:ElaA protein